MKRLTRTAVMALVVGAGVVGGVDMTGTPVHAAAPARLDGRNAALYYWRAFYSMDRDFQREAGELLGAPDRRPDDSTVSKLKNNGAAIRDLLAATRIDRCDFGIAYEEGFMALLPHLGLMRSSSRILILDTRRLMAEGDWDGAAERIAAIYRMSVHVRNDNVLISSLVGIAMTAAGHLEAEVLVQSGHLTPGARDNLLGALQPLNQADGFGVKRCIEMEKNITVDYLTRTLKGPEAGKKLVEMNLSEIEPKLAEELKLLDEAGVRADLEKIGGFYVEMLGAWDAPDFEARFRVIEDKLLKGEYGLIARIIVPAMSKAKGASVQSEKLLREMIHALQTAATVEPGQPAGAGPAPAGR